MIDVSKEKLIGMEEARRYFPVGPAGLTSGATLCRYSSIGLRGIVLETVKAGRYRSTSIEAIKRFLEAIEERENSKRERVSRVVEIMSRRSHKTEHDAAMEQLKAAGFKVA